MKWEIFVTNISRYMSHGRALAWKW